VSDLLVTTHTPLLGSGRALRTYGVARALAAAGDGLDLLYARFDGDRPDQAFAAIGGVRMHAVEPTRGPARALAFLRARARGVPTSIARGVVPELAAAAARLAPATGGRVVADGPVAAAALMLLGGGTPFVYNAHNLESAGFRHEVDATGLGSPAALRRFERRLLGRAQESWMVSELDLAGAAELCPQARLRYAPNVVDVDAIEPVEPDPGARRALFVANFAYEPNRDGLAFLLAEVMPRVWEELPDATVALAGGGLTESPGDPRVRVLGFVADLRSAYSGASCALVPLRVGGGTPLKLIEGLAYALPVVATPRAAAAVGAEDGSHCLVAGDGAGFAAAIVQLMTAGGREIGRGGRTLASERYSIQTLTRLLASG
jgi:glycosyltransferase involved in cell wall biosynthesis